MADYIDREKIFSIWRSMPAPASVTSLAAAISQTPAADVAPVVHGKWEPGNPICPVCGENKFKDLDADVWADWQPKFCPNCGTLMDGKEDEHEVSES